MAYAAENIPESTMKDLIIANWVAYNEVPIPNVVVANDPDDPKARIDLMNPEDTPGDYIVIYSDGPESIKMRGNYSYYDRNYILTLDIRTKESRQRLRDVYYTIRAMMFDNKHSITGWQLGKPVSYQEMVQETLNIWRGIVRIQLDNHGVSVESL